MVKRLDKPKISWHVLEEIQNNEYEYMQCKTYNEEGSYTPGEVISKSLQVWNNCNGNKAVQDAKDCKLVISFKHFEDNILLHLIKVKVDEREEVPLSIDVDRGFVDIGTIYGDANNGSSLNSSNYKTLVIKIGPIPENIKSELKSMYFYLEYSPN